MLVLIDLAEVLSFERLRRRTPLGTLCLEIAGSDGILSCAPMFFLTVWFGKERHEALLYVFIMAHVSSNDDIICREYDENRDLRTSNSLNASLYCIFALYFLQQEGPQTP
jgi:hypothetical protein